MVQITLREFIDQFQQDLNDPVSTNKSNGRNDTKGTKLESIYLQE